MIDSIFFNIDNFQIQTDIQIQKVSDQIHNLKSKLLEQIDSIQNNLQLWLKQTNSNFNVLNREDIAQAKLQYQKIREDNKNYITKISNALNKLKNCEEYQNCFNILEGIHKEKGEIKLINTITQYEECNAISINKSGSLIATGDAENISIWEFKEGNMKRVQQLLKHPQYISALIFSRKTNSFISGCKGGRIHCWQQTVGIGNFISRSEQFQNGAINCMILNKEDNQLFCGSEANKIIVWKVDFESYLLTIIQELETQAQVEGLTLNPSEQILAFTQNNKNISIYKNQNNKNWHFHSNATKTTDESGSRICFLSENAFIWITGERSGIDSICFFEEENGEFREIERKIKLTQNKNDYDFHQFDIIHQREKNILIIKQKLQIWIMRVMYNELETIYVIQCKSTRTFGTLTPDGSKFIYFERIDNKVGKFYIYSLDIK